MESSESQKCCSVTCCNWCCFSFWCQPCALYSVSKKIGMKFPCIAILLWIMIFMFSAGLIVTFILLVHFDVFFEPFEFKDLVVHDSLTTNATLLELPVHYYHRYAADSLEFFVEYKIYLYFIPFVFFVVVYYIYMCRVRTVYEITDAVPKHSYCQICCFTTCMPNMSIAEMGIYHENREKSIRDRGHYEMLVA